MNSAAIWALWRIRGLDTHFPPRLVRPIQRLVERAVARSPTALSIIYDTDKGPTRHSYTRYYGEFFKPVRNRRLTLIEIGIHRGASLRLWRSYLRRAEIVGVDLSLPELDLPGVEMHVGDQSDESFLQELISRYGGFDIVVDDGSHIASHVQRTFATLFPAVRPSGWYVIEDLETSYRESYEGGRPGAPGTAVSLVKDLVDRVQTDSGMRDVSELHVYDGIAFIRRASQAQTRR